MNDWTIHHGDGAALLADYAGRADLILTSPPYDGLRDYGGHRFDFEAMADACVAALAPGGVLVWVVADATVDGSETGTSMRQALHFMDLGLKLHDTMIYQKGGNNVMTYANRYWSEWEYMFALSAGAPKTVNLLADRPAKSPGETGTHTVRGSDGRLTGRAITPRPNHVTRSNIWKYMTGWRHSHPGEGHLPHEHPASFPRRLAEDHIRTWTNEGDLVIDPMAGSGTTLRAAVNLGRKAVGMEIHEPYVDIIRRRMAQAVLL